MGRQTNLETAHVEQTAEVIHAVTNAFSDSMTDILLNPDDDDDPGGLAQRRIEAMQTALERVLGAAPGWLPIIDERQLAAWFEKWV